MKDPDAIAAQLWKSETSEWDAVSGFDNKLILSVANCSVRSCEPTSHHNTSRQRPSCHCWLRVRTCSKDTLVRYVEWT